MSGTDTFPDALADDGLSLPRSPAPPARASFPLLAVLAPLAGAAILYAVTRSPFMLAFAALSPVIALASTVDSRVASRRRRRREARAYEESAADFLRRVALAHERERAALNTRLPAAGSILSDEELRPRRWATRDDGFVPLRLGAGARRSTLAVSGTHDTERERELRATARTLEDAPVALDPCLGLGVVGPLPVVRAVVRAMVVQLAHAHPPGVLAISAPDGDDYDWLDDYPHAAVPDRETLRLRVVDDRANVRADGTRSAGALGMAAPDGADDRAAYAVVAVAERTDDVPAGCRVVVRADASGTLQVLAAPHDALAATTVRGELITAQSAAAFGRDLAVAARTRGVAPGRALPQRVDFDQLTREHPTAASGPGASEMSTGLSATMAVTATGPLTLDLVASGPHAIVTGTTGSGKSELLISWALAMASHRTPDELALLLVDFKGGTAFRRLAALPHSVGVVTDLAHGEAARALKSLRAELRRREAALGEWGVSDVRDAGGRLPRLVIVVDEAAAMLTAFPDLAPLFSDIAARGRALGVHLILGTQRATGVLGDALLANCALRLSLRLSSAGDSTALLGTDAAARLPHALPGRFVMQCDGEILTAQAATTQADDVHRVAAEHRGSHRPAAPWLPALPSSIPLGAFTPVPDGGVVLGALDVPERQVQEGIVYRPRRAHLLVLGVRGSGRTGVLRAVLAQRDGESLVVPPDIEGAWDALETAAARLSSPGGPCLVAIDDVDALLARFDEEHRDTVLERVRSLLVDGPRAGVAVVCTAVVLPSGLRAVAPQFGERLLLRQADRQEHVLAGAPAELYDADAPPGRGVWRGHAAQVVQVAEQSWQDRPPASAVTPELTFPPGVPSAVVSAAPTLVLARLRAAGSGLEVIDLETGSCPAGSLPSTIGGTATSGGAAASGGAVASGITVSSSSGSVLVGDPDAWQANWALLNRLRAHSPIVFDGCGIAQVRAVLHARVTPPPVVHGHLLVRDPSGRFRRARMPGA